MTSDLLLGDTGLGSAVVRASAYGTGGPGSGHTKDFKNGSNGFFLGAQELRVSITTDSSVSV